ncbi:hypothetical protein KSS87_011481 [Heliosperma pusillum]|nr:hypothetical protein KSS87_011481 [Heliosperma pusillum]
MCLPLLFLLELLNMLQLVNETLKILMISSTDRAQSNSWLTSVGNLMVKYFSELPRLLISGLGCIGAFLPKWKANDVSHGLYTNFGDSVNR